MKTSPFQLIRSLMAPRGLLLGLGLCFVTGGLHAGETLGAQTLGSWTATAGAPRVDPATGSVSLPSGAQLSRAFAAKRIEVRLITRPVFGLTPADWAVLEVGPASLSFVRDPDGGGMVMLADEPLALPFALPLDETHRSKFPLDFAFSYDQARQTATLVIADVAFDIEAALPQEPLVVAVSSGQTAGWELDRLEVRLDAETEAGAASHATGGGGDTGFNPGESPTPLAGTRAENRRQAIDLSRGLWAEGKEVEAEKALTDANRNPKDSAEWHLESANELVRTAFSYSRSGKPELAVKLARRALAQAEQASSKAALLTEKTGIAAAADELSALIQERLLADPAEARVFYQRAAQRLPGGAAERQLQRLGRIEAEAARKTGSRSGAEGGRQ